MFEMKRNNQQGILDKNQIRHLFVSRYSTIFVPFSKQEADHSLQPISFSFRIKFGKKNLFSLEQNDPR